jgi:hypothetical protein
LVKFVRGINNSRAAGLIDRYLYGIEGINNRYACHDLPLPVFGTAPVLLQ